ncbi:UNVERIFIED_CONTAM: PI-PLC X domain-containing protein [Sesamum radiatum]|uniref:PI-PLC X domain-containing protein n=1 Tax=Sesamum radiatum TaxID=300843 RepID=A0AAW2RC05_SESRA
MAMPKGFLAVVTALLVLRVGAACSSGGCKVGDGCPSGGDCGAGLFCSSCDAAFEGSRCVRSTATNQFNIVNNSLPFNKYAFLTTHNAFAIDDGVPRLTFTNQEDTVAQQLNNGVRALMLDTYDFEGDIWLCHSFGGKCHDYTKFEPAIDTLREIEAFLSGNPSEIVTVILEDYVHTPNGLTKVFTEAGLMKFWFPLSKMPKNGQNWPLVSEMVANNQRLLVFTSIKSKESSEGIAYQWNYMVENQYGDDGMKAGECSNRGESSALNDKSKSLVLVNYFRSVPVKALACVQNSGDLLDMLQSRRQSVG